jgi:hypothetical protein
VFLPAISRLFAALLLLLAVACNRHIERAPLSDAELMAHVDVVAGTGEVGDDDLRRVREAVAASLPRLQKEFQRPLQRRFHVFVHADREHLPASLVASLHEDAAGFALLGMHQLHIVRDEIAGSGSTLAGVVAHELVHELLDQYAGEFGRLIPRWFHEGLAQVLAGDTYLHVREEELVFRLMNRSLLSFEQLRQKFPTAKPALRTAYAQSYSYVAWLHRRYGLPALLRLVAAVDRDISFEGALVGMSHRSTLDLAEAWRDSVLHSGAPWRVLFNSGFDLLLVAILPLLVLALRRRLQSESRAARRMAESEERDRRAEELRQAQLAAHARAMAAAGFAPPPVDEEAAAEPLPPGQWLPEALHPGRESPSSPPPSTR